jgi:YtkA-like
MKRIALALAAAAQLSACMIFMRPPSDPKLYEPTQTSAAQMYKVTMSPAESIKVGKLHSWSIQVLSADGKPVDSAKITVDGGMPQHGHGLPTKPLVTKQLGDGRHLVEGMKFNMGGWWVVKFEVASSQGSDVVTFNLKL